MTVVISASGFGTKAQDFADGLQAIIGDGFKVIPLAWQLTGASQRILDLMDTRDGKKVIMKVTSDLIGYLRQANENHENLIIVSQLAGSRIVEEALSMINGIDKLDIELRHVMLAPEITGSEWNSIGKFAAAAIMLGLAGIAASSKSKKGIGAAILGLMGSAFLAKTTTLSDRLSLKNEDDDLGFVQMDRFIFYNPENEKFDGLTELLFNGSFYKGEYTSELIASLAPENLEQVFRYSKWMRTSEKTKMQLLMELIQ